MDNRSIATFSRYKKHVVLVIVINGKLSASRFSNLDLFDSNFMKVGFIEVCF